MPRYIPPQERPKLLLIVGGNVRFVRWILSHMRTHQEFWEKRLRRSQQNG